MQLIMQNKPSISPKNWVRFWVRFLSLFVHICPFIQTAKASKIEAFDLKILNLALYARRDSNPQPSAPEANALFKGQNVSFLTTGTDVLTKRGNFDIKLFEKKIRVPY